MDGEAGKGEDEKRDLKGRGKGKGKARARVKPQPKRKSKQGERVNLTVSGMSKHPVSIADSACFRWMSFPMG